MGQLYQTQRAMRHMRKAAMQRGVIAILDVGTSKIACLVLRFDGDAPALEGVGSMAGQSNFRIIGAATTRSRGVSFGEVAAMAETERAILVRHARDVVAACDATTVVELGSGTSDKTRMLLDAFASAGLTSSSSTRPRR